MEGENMSRKHMYPHNPPDMFLSCIQPFIIVVVFFFRELSSSWTDKIIWTFSCTLVIQRLQILQKPAWSNVISETNMAADGRQLLYLLRLHQQSSRNLSRRNQDFIYLAEQAGGKFLNKVVLSLKRGWGRGYIGW